MRKMKKAAALSYEKGKDSAPRVVASGRGHIAERIINIAKENNVPLFEDDRSAEILCSTPLGSEVPEVLYQVIAEIYAVIFRMEKESKHL